MNRLIPCALLICALIIASCGDSTGPQESGESVLSLVDFSHFHTELSWTQHDLPDYEFVSYHLYRAASPGIPSDTTGAECIATYFEIGELEHADSLLEIGSSYYYALLTRIQEDGSQESSLWSNEVALTTKQIISTMIINNSGQTMYVEVHQGLAPPDSTPSGGQWLSNIGDNSHWVTGFDQGTCVAPIPSGDTFHFAYPEYAGLFGARMYLGENEFTGAPDLNTANFIYDKVETGWSATWNTTCVDFVGIPVQLSVNGNTYGFLGTVTRASLMDSLLNLPSPYNKLVFPEGSSDPVRFFSPGHYLSSPEMLEGCLDSSIQLGLPELVGTTWSYGADTYTNITYQSPDGMTATHNGTKTVTATEINTVNCLGNAIPNTGTAGGGRFAALIGAAANRGVLYDYDKWDSSNDYYKSSPDGNAGEFNYYSRVLHNLSIDKKCYGMAYDDYYEQASTATVNPGDTVIILILPFN